MSASIPDGNGRIDEPGALSRRAALAAGLLALSPAPAAAEAEAAAIETATTRALMQTEVPAGTLRVATRGFAFPGDGGGALWRRVDAAPVHGGYITDAKGAFFEIDEGVLRPEMFGAQGGDADDHRAIQQAVTVAVQTSRRVEFTKPRYSLAGEIEIPGDVYRFSFVGASFTTLMQLLDDTSIFLFGGENTSQWAISGLRFAWLRNQNATHRRSYAVRFESNRPGGAGHFNFEISNCIVVNGFRGFGQSDDGNQKYKCPVWGATFRLIRTSMLHSGSAIFLRTWGRTGQPNNRIEHFYGRCDAMKEPALVIESSDTAVLTSVEFNRGRGCQLFIENSSNIIVEGTRFEEVELGAGDAFVSISGGQTNVRLSGLSVQSVKLVAPQPEAMSQASLVRVSNGARLNLDGFTDMPWRSPLAKRDLGMRRSVAVLDIRRGTAVAGAISPLVDPSFILTRQSTAGQLSFRDAESYCFAFQGAGELTFLPQLVRQRGSIVAVSLYTEGVNEDNLRGLQLLRNGEPILNASSDLTSKQSGRQQVVLPNALRGDEQRLILMPADLLTLVLPRTVAAAAKTMVLFSVTATGG
ncbi:hypothetical protein V5F59_17930 [Xanthobacter autotrophicus DSM 431]|uniref:hypothetical protein n=1 Tax=Xanthobacter nonsaccharivorans TaxID=3119912 RepID=UPI00372BA620